MNIETQDSNFFGGNACFFGCGLTLGNKPANSFGGGGFIRREPRKSTILRFNLAPFNRDVKAEEEEC